MKKYILTLLVGAMLAVSGMLMFTTSASAYSVGPTNVGGLDTFLASGNVNSGDQNEISWVNGVLTGLGISTQYTTDDLVKYTNTSSGWNWTVVNGETRIVASDLQGTPEYFYLKLGGVRNTPLNHFLYRNEADLNWAVINLDTSFGSAIQVGVIGDYGKISHTGELGGGAPVPEPGTMMLLGIGMLGLAVYGKRRSNEEA